MATHSSILAWKSPWTEESGGLQSMVLQKIGHDWSNLASTTVFEAIKCSPCVYDLLKNHQNILCLRSYWRPKMPKEHFFKKNLACFFKFLSAQQQGILPDVSNPRHTEWRMRPARLRARAAATGSGAGCLILPTLSLPCVAEAKVPNSSVLAFLPAPADPGDGQTLIHTGSTGLQGPLNISSSSERNQTHQTWIFSTMFQFYTWWDHRFWHENSAFQKAVLRTAHTGLTLNFLYLSSFCVPPALSGMKKPKQQLLPSAGH